MSRPDPAAVFVYGTLMPGHLRWPLIEALVVGRRPARTVGALYDTGHGYPALAPGDEIVHGWLLELAPDRTRDALALLDEIEGPGYVREILDVEDGSGAVVLAHAYLVVGSTADLAPIPDGRWAGDAER